MLTITDLVKVYATGTSALNGVGLAVDEPQVVAVIGSSGAGKSTLIRCVNRLVEPSSGRILLGDTEVTALGRRELALKLLEWCGVSMPRRGQRRPPRAALLRVKRCVLL